MSQINKIKIGDQIYNIEDANLKEQCSALSDSLSTINGIVNNGLSSLSSTMSSLQTQIGNTETQLQEV